MASKNGMLNLMGH